MKTCRDCGETKKLEEMVKNKVFKSGYDTLCLVCNRKRVKQWRKDNPDKRKEQAKKESVGSKVYNIRKHLKANYGMTVEEYDHLYNQQHGCCDICGVHQSNLKKRLSVDHCHKSGNIRGLLCPSCNYMLGHAKDDISILENAKKYLQKHTG